MSERMWCLDGLMTGPPQRDPREDDPQWYRNLAGEWVKRTQWSADVYPEGWDEYCRYVEETTPQQREAILMKRKRREGLVRWNSSWVTPERAEELETKLQDGLKSDRKALAEARHHQRRFWC